MAKRATHIVDAVGDAAYAAALVNRAGRVLCGKPLYYITNLANGANRARELTVSIANFNVPLPRPRSKPDPKRCTACWRLARMTPAERAIEATLKEHTKKEALAKLKSKTDERNQVERAARMAHIDAMRLDVHVCRDAFEQGGFLVDAVSTRKVLDAAVELYRFEHRSGGDKLIVMLPGTRVCPYSKCQYQNEAQTPAHDECTECGSRLRAYGRASKRHVACRFCRTILGRNCDPFADHSRSFFDESGFLLRNDSPTKPVDVWRHTVLCAFDYLNPIAKTNQTDEPIVLAGHLPSEPFVLEHDR